MKLTSFARAAATTFTLSFACMLPAQAQSVPGQSVSGQGSWETTLLGRDINLNAVAATDVSAVYLYDTTLGVTWLRNANANVTGNVFYADANATASGRMTWANATAWADNLSTGSDGNTISNWRLPTMTDTGTPGCNSSYGGTDCGYNPATSTSEMASLFFNTLGNKAFYNTSGAAQAGYGLTNAGSFQNMQSDVYWLGTEYAPGPVNAWTFYTYVGVQNAYGKGSQFYALAVRPGDVSPAPEPETYAMMLAGLALIGAIGRRRSRNAASSVAQNNAIRPCV
jgi:hypothetical protein